MLTEMQKKIVNSSGKVIIKACPGSGKTYTVAYKLRKEVTSWENNYSGIAVLSFTNVACTEIKNKYKEINNGIELSYPHFIGTFDSFIYKYIFSIFGVLITKTKGNLIVENSNLILKLRDKFWKRECYQSGCDPYSFYIEDGKIQDLKNKVKICTIKEKPCEKLKLKCNHMGYYNYDDVLCICISILKRRKDILNILIRRFPMIILDEAQDISEKQMELLEILIENGLSNIMLIGDPDQAIYEWRNANPEIFLNKFKLEEWTRIVLNENFRSSQNICNATHCFSTLKKISTSVGENKEFYQKPILIKYDINQIDKLLEFYINICKENKIFDPTKIAILNRSKDFLLSDYKNINDLWKNDLAILLSKCVKFKLEKDFLNLYKYSEKILYYLLTGYDINSGINYEFVFDIMDEFLWKRKIIELCSKLKEKDIILTEWVSETEMLLRELLKEYKDFLKVEIKLLIKRNDLKMRDFKSHKIDEFFNINTLKYIVSTIHGVKGCTFDAILLVVNMKGKMTSNVINNSPITSEEIRNAYVAMTRPKKILIVAIPNTVKDKDLTRFPTDLWDYQKL